MNNKKWFFIFSLLFLFPIRPVVAQTITIATDPWCPYVCAPGEKPGYMTEIAQAIFEMNGYTFNYLNMPWARAISEARTGNIDGVIATLEAETPDFLFPVAFGKATNRFYARKGEKWKYTGIESLKSIRLGAIKNYSYTEEIDAYVAQYQGTDAVQVVTSENGLTQNIKKLLGGRIDIIISADKVFQYTADEMATSMDHFSDAGVLFDPSIYIGFSPAPHRMEKSKSYVEMINKGLSVLRESGKLDAIMKKYGLTDWE